MLVMSSHAPKVVFDLNRYLGLGWVLTAGLAAKDLSTGLIRFLPFLIIILLTDPLVGPPGCGVEMLVPRS